MATRRELVERYFRQLETFVTEASAWDDILDARFTQTEFPNALTPATRTRERTEALADLARSRGLLTSQRYVLQHFVDAGDTCVAEATWEGQLAIDAGALRNGQVLRANFCCVFEFESGRIVRQRNYDCFERFDVG